VTREWDAIVVGAGIIGCAVGRELARRGARTAILESRTAGAGATQASAGVLAPYIEAPGEGPLHQLTVRSLGLYDAFIAELERETGAGVEYRRCGTLEVAPDGVGAARLAALAIWTRSAGVDARWIDAREVMHLEPALGPCEGALLVPAHGYVRVPQLTSSLVAAAERSGATLIAGEPVKTIAPDGTGLTVETAVSCHRGATVVIAAGSWSGSLGWEKVPVKPIRGQLVRLRWNAPPISHVLWSDRCYVVPWLDGTVLVGATVEDVGFDERTTAAGVRDLLDAACDLMPKTWGAGFIDARAGLRPATTDGLPIIGRSRQTPALVYASGHYRNGILLAPLTAQLVADLVIDGRSDPVLEFLSPSRYADSQSPHGMNTEKQQ
jgi:glycine oxidase